MHSRIGHVKRTAGLGFILMKSFRVLAEQCTLLLVFRGPGIYGRLSRLDSYRAVKFKLLPAFNHLVVVSVILCLVHTVESTERFYATALPAMTQHNSSILAQVQLRKQLTMI